MLHWSPWTKFKGTKIRMCESFDSPGLWNKAHQRVASSRWEEWFSMILCVSTGETPPNTLNMLVIFNATSSSAKSFFRHWGYGCNTGIKGLNLRMVASSNFLQWNHKPLIDAGRFSNMQCTTSLNHTQLGFRIYMQFQQESTVCFCTTTTTQRHGRHRGNSCWSSCRCLPISLWSNGTAKEWCHLMEAYFKIMSDTVHCFQVFP